MGGWILNEDRTKCRVCGTKINPNYDYCWGEYGPIMCGIPICIECDRKGCPVCIETAQKLNKMLSEKKKDQ